MSGAVGRGCVAVRRAPPFHVPKTRAHAGWDSMLVGKQRPWYRHVEHDEDEDEPARGGTGQQGRPDRHGVLWRPSPDRRAAPAGRVAAIGWPMIPILALHPEDILPIAAVILLWVALRKIMKGR